MTSDNIYQEETLPGTFRRAWRHFCANTTAMVGLYCTAALLLLCLFGGWLAPYNVDQQFMGFQLLPPSWSRYGDISFFLGTDDLGRDILSRLLTGAASSVGAALLVTLLASACAMVLGAAAGITHGFRSAMMNHVLDMVLSIPSLLLAIIVVAFTGPSLFHAMIAVCLALIPRLVRAIYLAIRDEMSRDYVTAARLDGARPFPLLKGTILPNILPVLVSEFTRGLSAGLLDIAVLGSLGLGAPLPSPEWGAMLGDSLELIYVAPWTVMIPGAALMSSVLVINLLGDGIRRAIEAGVK